MPAIHLPTEEPTCGCGARLDDDNAVQCRKCTARARWRDVLRDRYYLGYVTNRGQEYAGRHEPLITQELFDQVAQA